MCDAIGFHLAEKPFMKKGRYARGTYLPREEKVIGGLSLVFLPELISNWFPLVSDRLALCIELFN